MAAQPLMLEIQTGKHKGRRVRLVDAEIIVGRGDEARIRIASAEVSREHCKLIPEQNKVLVIDLNSRNGTFVDGRPVNGERWLAPGGTLTVGPLTFLLIGDEQAQQDIATKVALKGKTKVSDKLSDDDIADWLSDSEMPTASANSPTETSIIKNAAATPDASPPGSSVEIPAVSPAPIPAGKRREFRTISEEAQDIIRRHYEMLAAEEAES